jgi:mannose-1-phosphate guanylyltransferase
MEPEADSDIIAVFPADHYIQDQAAFHEALDVGAEWAQAGYFVTFGVSPTRPETGYGYILSGAPLDGHNRVFKCEHFLEKPDYDRATAFLEQGGYYWNCGIFMFRRDVLLEAFSQHMPDLYPGLLRLGADPSPENLSAIY